MYRKDVNERSPMRVFEKSMHGGLGRGNVGVVASRPGVGKTPLLVQIALDDLLRDRKVLHISHEHAVDHVRAYYDEIFHDLSVASKLDDTEAVKLDVERHRLIYSHLSHTTAQPMSNRGGRSSIAKILETVAFARDIAHFEADVIIIDGFDFHHASVCGLTRAFAAYPLHDWPLAAQAATWRRQCSIVVGSISALTRARMSNSHASAMCLTASSRNPSIPVSWIHFTALSIENLRASAFSKLKSGR